MVGGMALKGNPYDGHSMRKALQQVRRLSGQCIEEVFVDRGYRGHDESESEVYVLGQWRGVKTRRLKRCMKRRQVIESVISHLKNDGWLGRNHLKGEVGNQMNVLLSCAGHDLRLVLKSLEIFCLQIWGLWERCLEDIFRFKRRNAQISSGIGLLRDRSMGPFTPQLIIKPL